MIKEHPFFVILFLVFLFATGASVYERGYNKGYGEGAAFMQQKYKYNYKANTPP